MYFDSLLILVLLLGIHIGIKGYIFYRQKHFAYFFDSSYTFCSFCFYVAVVPFTFSRMVAFTYTFYIGRI